MLALPFGRNEPHMIITGLVDVVLICTLALPSPSSSALPQDA